MKSVLQGTDKSAIVGSLKDLLYKRRMERQLAAARGLISGPEMPPMEDGEGGGAGGGGLLPAAGAKGGYVPPSVRNRGAAGMSMGDSMHRRGDDNSVRVTNLSEDTREDDLRVSGGRDSFFSSFFCFSGSEKKNSTQTLSLLSIFSSLLPLSQTINQTNFTGPLLALRPGLPCLHRGGPRDRREPRLRLRQLRLQGGWAARHRQAGRLRVRLADPARGVGCSQGGKAVKLGVFGRETRERFQLFLLSGVSKMKKSAVLCLFSNLQSTLSLSLSLSLSLLVCSFSTSTAASCPRVPRRGPSARRLARAAPRSLRFPHFSC